jgi:hypothetical protein
VNRFAVAEYEASVVGEEGSKSRHVLLVDRREHVANFLFHSCPVSVHSIESGWQSCLLAPAARVTPEPHI